MRTSFMGILGILQATALAGGACGSGAKAIDARGTGGNNGAADGSLETRPGTGGASDAAPEIIAQADTGLDSGAVDAVPNATDVGPQDGVGAVDAEGVDAGPICTWMGTVLSVGQSIDTDDGCHTCTCELGGMACKTRACLPAPDAAALVCSLPSELYWHATGDGSCGPSVRIDTYSIDSGTQMTVSRIYNGCGIDQQIFHSCSPPLPACGASGVVSISTLAQDLGSPDVRTAWGATQVSVYGQGSAWFIAYGGGTIQVGYPCPSPVMNSCRPIPPGIQILVDDLRSLGAAMVAAPECAGL